MNDTVLSLIDEIEYNKIISEMEVLESLSDLYDKQDTMLEYSSDLSLSSFYLESETKKDDKEEDKKDDKKETVSKVKLIIIKIRRAYNMAFTIIDTCMAAVSKFIYDKAKKEHYKKKIIAYIDKHGALSIEQTQKLLISIGKTLLFYGVFGILMNPDVWFSYTDGTGHMVFDKEDVKHKTSNFEKIAVFVQSKVPPQEIREYIGKMISFLHDINKVKTIADLNKITSETNLFNNGLKVASNVGKIFNIIGINVDIRVIKEADLADKILDAIFCLSTTLKATKHLALMELYTTFLQSVEKNSEEFQKTVMYTYFNEIIKCIKTCSHGASKSIRDLVHTFNLITTIEKNGVNASSTDIKLDKLIKVDDMKNKLNDMSLD